jgi:hypothetical protein
VKTKSRLTNPVCASIAESYVLLSSNHIARICCRLAGRLVSTANRLANPLCRQLFYVKMPPTDVVYNILTCRDMVDKSVAIWFRFRTYQYTTCFRQMHLSCVKSAASSYNMVWPLASHTHCQVRVNGTLCLLKFLRERRYFSFHWYDEVSLCKCSFAAP